MMPTRGEYDARYLARLLEPPPEPLVFEEFGRAIHVLPAGTWIHASRALLLAALTAGGAFLLGVMVGRML